MLEHRDMLNGLTKKSSLQEKLINIHHSLSDRFPFVVRIAVAVYDHKTKVLKTFLHSSAEENPLEHYQSLLDNAPSLKSILKSAKPRVINDLLELEEITHEHTKKINAQGYRASYTLPIYNEGQFVGFLFFNADKKDVFNEEVLNELDLYAHIISLYVVNEFGAIETMNAAIKTTGNLSHIRDPETGKHLDRMSHYSRIIAKELADKYDLDDNYIEHIFMFAPLHDIGKIGIPDSILLKPAALNSDEMAVMQTHASIGSEMVSDLLQNFGLSSFEHVDVLHNIAMHHHEAVDGSGYPKGIKGNEIPLEARIIAVADVFDALTSKRCYKEAWSNEEAIETLIKLADVTLDKDCVNALVKNITDIEEVQIRFKE
ncbi:HD domain-containing protein [Sulfurimonas aquatica]|uniref:HD domain-containing protein n=1 Tax=Sulfurimonas aquatica TaxID=2672570 RepID=A0A975AXX5_9BACT|nr:HD domain-containing phosphohydrolase [Sulfurimonas aquatica]QSZ40636.1 HD domain-containing protein [Sulfurimonas aquatica]